MISPGVVQNYKGIQVRTLWGELAWQLGVKKAFARIKADDENATSPGDVLRELFNGVILEAPTRHGLLQAALQRGGLPLRGFERRRRARQLEYGSSSHNC